MMPTTYVDFRESLEAGRTSCVEATSQFIERCDSSNLNAIIHLDREGALRRAHELDQIDRSALPLAGMVVGVKDVINAAGLPLTCASKSLDGFQSLFDATVVARLKRAGAIVLGKLNCDEFAMGSSNENSVFGPVLNPANPEYVPGGSSGGSAAAVGGGLCHVALGSDTGGSIRQPASFCGVIGMKPTYGRVSRYGLVAFASSLDSIGPMARCLEDIELVLSVICGPDDNDATCLSVGAPISNGRMDRPLRIGVPREYFRDESSAGLDPQIRGNIQNLIDALTSAGTDVIDVALPHTEYGVATYYIIASAEASSNLARFDGVRYGYRAPATEAIYEEMDRDGQAERTPLDAMYTASRTIGLGSEVKRRVMLGTYALSSGYYDAYYDKAMRVRSLIRRDFDKAFEDVDVILAPVTPGPAYRLGERVDDVLAQYLGDIFTVPSSLAGIPGLALPTGKTSEGLPIGVQLIGPSLSESTLIEVAKRIQDLIGSGA